MIRAFITGLAVITALSGMPSVQPAFSQEESDQRLGTVHFPTWCNETAQRRFDRGMRYQHSFWYRESRGIFEDVIKADPECGIAYWGIALSYLDNPHNPPPPANLPLGMAAIQKAKAIGAKTQRERDFIDALLVFYTDYDKIPHAARVQAYLKAIEAVAQRYPDDDEAQLFYGITLNVAASPNDKTYSNQLKGAAILGNVFQRQPRHPGVAHYLIHLYDTPALAEKGLDAAKRYSEIAPAAPHAQHMPTHIFTRVGYWKESIALNTVSARVAKADKEPVDQLHAMDYLVYAHLQLAQDGKAREVVEEMSAVPNSSPFAGAYALAASPARYMIERNDWKGAAELQVRLTPFAHVEAMTHFARALGAARTGNPDAAKTEVAKLAELRDKLREAKDAYWSEQVDIQWQVASAWLLYAEGKYDAALKAMSAAADAEDRTEKHPVTPGVPLANPDFAPFLQRARNLGPDTLFVFPANQSAIFAKQFLERGMDKSGIRLVGTGDLTDDDELPGMTDAALGIVTAHHYSALHDSPLNRAYVADYQAKYGKRPNYHSVAGYDGMHLIYEALKKTKGNADGDALVTAMKGLSWESPRGPISIDPETRDIVQNEYIRRVQRVTDQLYNVEFATVEAVKDPLKVAKK